MNAMQIRADITKRIIEALEKGFKPWSRPWGLDANLGHPTSVSTKRKYRGINPLLLDIGAWGREGAGKWWATFNQWKSLDASVKKAEKCTYIVLYTKWDKKTQNPDGSEDIAHIPILKYFSVFNVCQVNGADHLRPDGSGTNEGILDYSTADHTIEATSADIVYGGNSAHFNPASKKIACPYKNKFDTEENFYTTMFHELSHWADKKIGAKIGKRFGDEDYFFGELVAEISACYLSDHCGIPTGKRWNDSINYLGSWIDKMKKDNAYILKASSRASQISDYILAFSEKNAEIETV